MKTKLWYLMLLLWPSGALLAQDCLNTGHFQGTNGWGACTPMSTVLGATRIFTAQASETGNRYFRFYGDGAPCGEYGPSGSEDVAMTVGVVQNLTCVGGAGKAYYVNASNTSWNYVFKAGGVGASNANEGKAVVFEVQGPVQSVTDVSQPSGALYIGQSYTVEATLSGALSTGQGVYLAYSTDYFSTATVVEMSGSGTSYTYTIPAQAGNTDVSYYTFTSGSGLSISTGDVALYTINFRMNGGESYYNYAVLDYYLANTDGNWSAPSTWANGAVPPSGANAAIDAAVTMDIAPVCTNVELFSASVNMGAGQLSCERLILNSGTTFNLSSGSLSCKYLTIAAGGAFDAGSGVLTVTTGGRIQTTGSFNAGSGKVVFAGIGELSGAITFNNVDIHNGVDFRTSHSGTIGVAVINGTLSVKSGGYVSTAYSPKYGSNSTLEYNTGGNYFAANEWNSSWWILDNPQHVLVTNGTALRITTGRVAYGDVTVNQNGLLSLEGADPYLSCHNLYIASDGAFSGGPAGVLSLDANGLLSNSGSYSAGSSKVRFGGPGAVSGTVSLYNVDVINGNVDFGDNVTVTGTLSIKLQGLVLTNGPHYGPASTLEYMSEYFEVADHTARREWEYPPNNVVLNHATLTFPDNVNRAVSGTMTVPADCTFSLSNLSPFTCGQLNIASGGIVNAADGVITIHDGGSMVNNGTFNAQSGKVVFDGAGTATGTLVFNHVDLKGNVNFGENATLNGILSIRSGGAVESNPPVYGPNAILEYATGGAYLSGIELNEDYWVTVPPASLVVTNFTQLSMSKQAWVAGDVTIHAGSEVNADYYFTVEDDLVNSGTLNLSGFADEDFDLWGDLENNGVLNTNGRIVNFYGTGVQVIKGSVPVAFDQLQIDNPAGVTLNAPATVVHALYLTQGNITLGNYDLTFLEGSDSYKNTGLTSHVVTNGSGGVVNEMPADLWAASFPVGSVAAYHPVFLEFTGAPASGGTLKARFIANAPGTSGLPITQGGVLIGTVSPSGYWEINAGDGLAGGVYYIEIDASGFTQTDGVTPITDMEGIRLIKRTSGGNWTPAGTAYAPSGLDYLVLEDLTGFSDFAVGGTGAALPVELTDIRAYPFGNDNIVEWAAAEEIDLKCYVVQRCVDIQHWTDMGTVAATGGGMYQFADHFPAKGTTYYRLKMTDFSGKTTFSNIVSVVHGGGAAVLVYPNPAADEVRIQVNSESNGAALIRITDVSGRLVQEQTVDLQKGVNQWTVPVGQLPSGMYFIGVNGAVTSMLKTE